MPTRADRGLERYNPETNMMEIGGVGSVPKDLGISMEKEAVRAAPRRDVPRVTRRWCLRGGFGITNDPYSLARPMRTNHPVLLNLHRQRAELVLVGRPDGRWRAAGDPDAGSRQRHHPDSVERHRHHAARRFNRGYIKSWNVAVQKELKWGFVGEAAYVATRQIDQLGVLELNWSPIGGGQAGPAAGSAVRPDGADHADARRSATPNTTRCRRGSTDASRTAFQLGVNYTLSKATGSPARRAATARRGS